MRTILKSASQGPRASTELLDDRRTAQLAELLQEAWIGGGQTGTSFPGLGIASAAVEPEALKLLLDTVYVEDLVTRVQIAKVLILASPTYKASYTGLLKSFFDRFPSDGLNRVAAIPALTIGSPAHALAVEHTLRPLLVELGASVPTRGLSFEVSSFDNREAVLEKWIKREVDALCLRS